MSSGALLTAANAFTKKSPRKEAARVWLRSQGSRLRGFTSVLTSDPTSLSDRCDLNIVTSPYPPIPETRYLPFVETVTEKWVPNSGGHLDEEIAIIDGTTGLTRTFGETYEMMTHMAAALRDEMGVVEESTVALIAPNHVDYLPVTLAVSLCGAKLTPINPVYKAGELLTILDCSRSTVLITHTSTLETALEAAKESKHIKHVVVMTDDDGRQIPEGTINLDSLKAYEGKILQTVQDVHHKVESHPMLLPYSSGTTGLPKGVCLTHKNLVTNLLQYATVEDMSFAEDQKMITPLPFFHIYGFTCSMVYCAWKGNTVITMSGRFDLETFCQLVQEHQPERTQLVPPILLGLAKSPIVDKYDLSSIRQVTSAAAPLSSDIEIAVKERIGCEVKQGWGMSELSPIATLNSDFNSKSGSVGPLVSSTYGRIIDEEGNSLGPNQSGELVIKGPQVMLGYLDEPGKTAECLSSTGWLRTGDVAHYDEDGYFYITDRLKELIKVRGYPVAPAELEALLLQNEKVSDAAVIQVPDEASGELPRAYVVLQQGVTATEDEIKSWVKERVAPYKRLDGGIVFVDAVPKSASGKILRRILRDQVAAESQS